MDTMIYDIIGGSRYSYHHIIMHTSSAKVLGTRYWIKYNYIITYVIGRVMCNKYEYSYEYYLFTLIYIDRYHEYR